MKISVVIPNYNGREILAKNLPYVLTTEVDEVIVVDDGSTDGSLENIKYQISSFDKLRMMPSKVEASNIKYTNQKLKIKLIKNQKNLGFSSAVNKGIEAAGGEVVILLNTDVSPEPDFLKPLVVHFSDPMVFAVGCMDKSFEDGKVVLRGRGVGSWQRGFLVHERGEVDKTDTLWVSCGSGAFRKDLWLKLGGLDPLYSPFYWEDIDLSYRAQKAGYKVLFEPKSIVLHHHEEGVIKKIFSPFSIKKIAYRNQFFFVWKNITNRKMFISHLVWLPYHLLKALVRLDFPFILGFVQAFVKLPAVIRKRLEVKKFFVRKDNEVI